MSFSVYYGFKSKEVEKEVSLKGSSMLYTLIQQEDVESLRMAHNPWFTEVVIRLAVFFMKNISIKRFFDEY